MSDEIIKVPDIGSGEAEVIEVCVKPGDTVSAEDSLIVLESDKASMEVPAPQDGVVTEVLLNVGDSVSEGAPMVKMAAADTAAAPELAAETAPTAEPAPAVSASSAASAIESVRVPDIGAENVPVIEICVNVGDTVALEDSLIVLESDKATMEVPSPVEGVVKAIHVTEGDALNQGDLVIDVEVSGGSAAAVAPAPAEAPAPTPAAPAAAPAAPIPQTGPRMEQITVPDIGAENVPVIEVCVKVGDTIEEEASLIVLESDKATMEVPSPFSGVVKSIAVNEGDSMNQGDLILTLEVSGGTAVPASAASAAPAPALAPTTAPAPTPSRAPTEAPPRAEANPVELERLNRTYHAGPAVRKLAREFGVDLALVRGTGPRRRILKEDVQKYVKSRLNEKPKAATTSGLGIPAMPEIDFSKWGEIETVPLNRLRKVAAQNFQRSWLNVPHVTQFDECDITEMEAFRKAQKAMAEKTRHQAYARAVYSESGGVRAERNASVLYFSKPRR